MTKGNQEEPGGGTSRRSFLQWSGAAGAGLAAATVLPAALASAPAAAEDAGSHGPGDRSLSAVTPKFDPVRPPAIPLAVKSPYLNTWLAADNSSGNWPTFWTGRITAMLGMIRIDGESYLFLGSEPALPPSLPYALPTMRELLVDVSATQTKFVLQNGGIELTLSFFTPVEPGDLTRQSRPLSYISTSVRSIDGATHSVSVYLDISGEWASADSNSTIGWNAASYRSAGRDMISLNYARSAPQVLHENADTAEWGTIVLSSEDSASLTWQISQDSANRAQYITTGKLTNTSDSNQPRRINDNWPVFGFANDFGKVGRKATHDFVISIGHVREPAVSYLGANLEPLWKSYYQDWQSMVAAFHDDYLAALRRSAAIDIKVAQDAIHAGGERYSALCALALRQAYAGTELVSGPDGKPWAFLKEISSDGNVSTIDVTYPCMPVFLYLDPQYLGLILAPILDYVENHNYPKLFAPHDLGSSYPNASGHLNGQGEEDMPVEETANMLLMAGAYLSKIPSVQRGPYASAHYKIFKQWADYLVENALDPGNQNQTDDFTGFIAHSVNLALKGILGIGAMAQIAGYAGNTADATNYAATAKSYIEQWAAKGTDSSGKHMKLAYDQDGTWSLKYNGYPDRLLKLNLIPDAVPEREAAWYLSRVNTYGVPLDIRHTYTKDDWEMWTAAWLKQYPEVGEVLINGAWSTANTSGRRVPMSDWTDTVTGQQVGFQARPVVGGFFALLTV
ncbi:MAG TPA: DUF5127 domain-containing protein [Jatrophihabitans sp.]|nr:DUF5127 domain-containing protein [Jatrophihabitans sp.]